MAAAEAVAEAFPIGTRVVDGDGFKATVVYIGPVATAKNAADTWLGVIWDNASRGKHDGSVVDNEGKIHRYFSCAQDSGSFVKPSKISKGRSFVEALQERYVEMDAALIAPHNILPGALVNTSRGTKQIEFIGETNIRKWQQIPGLNKVSMRGDTVSYAGTDIASVASHVQEIDLQDTLIVEWNEIAAIASQLPELTILHLNGNGLRPLDQEQVDAFPPGCFRELRALVLNSCKISTWATLQLLEPLLPQLEELYLANNPLFSSTDASAPNHADIALSGFSKLRVLDLTETGIVSWATVAEFGQLPDLEELRLDGNPIESCQGLLDKQPQDFASVGHLTLSSTRLASWLDVDALRSMHSLRSLRLTNIPLFQGKGASEVRPLMIARIPQLKFLNGSSISEKERMDSEKNYLRRALRELQAGSREGEEAKSTEEVRRFYQLFDVLAEKYGTDMGAAPSTTGSVTMAAEMMKVTLQSMAAGSVTIADVDKNLPGSLAVGRLKLMMSKIFGLEPSRQVLYFRSPGEDLPTPLDDDAQSLSYFGVCAGCTISMNEIA